MKTAITIIFLLFFGSCTDIKEPAKADQNNNTKSQNIILNNADSVLKISDTISILPEPPTIKDVVPLEPNRPIICFPSNISCEDKGGDMENGFVEVCLFENYDFSSAYTDYKERNKGNDDGRFLENSMPNQNLIKKFKESHILTASYSYRSKDILEIDLSFDGGNTTIVFEDLKNANSIKITTTHYPD